jgi:hypothetical protein
MTRSACAMARERVKPGQLRVTARARRRRCRGLRPVRSMARRAATIHVRVKRARLLRMAGRARRVFPERARVRIVARCADRMALRRAARLLGVALRTPRLLRGRVRLAMALAALRMAAPRRVSLRGMASRAERRAGAGERELIVRSMARDARDGACMERAVALRFDVAGRARRDHASVLRMRLVASHAGPSFGRGMIRLQRGVARRACVGAALARRVRVVAARARGVLLDARRGKRRHAGVASGARSACQRRRVRSVATGACGVASNLDCSVARGVASLAAAYGRFLGAVWLMAGDAGLVSGDTRPRRRDLWRGLSEHARRRARVAARASVARGVGCRVGGVACRTDLGARSAIRHRLHPPVTGSLMVASGAVGEVGRAVHRVAARASDVFRTMCSEVLYMQVGDVCALVTADARWRRSVRRKDMARRARRRRVRVSVMGSLGGGRMAPGA